MSESAAFQHLQAFLTSKMRMSHIYEPLMLRVLLENGGRASLRQIAAAFLAKDESQLEYYEEITKAMPGKILIKHGIVARDGAGYRLAAAQRLIDGARQPARSGVPARSETRAG